MAGDIDYRMISTRNRIPGKVVSVTSDRLVYEVIVENSACPSSRALDRGDAAQGER
jgi:hypothetical protein